MFGKRERMAAMTLARARSTLALLEAADVQQRADRILNRPAPRIVFKTKDDALIVPHPRLRYHRTEAWIEKNAPDAREVVSESVQ